MRPRRHHGATLTTVAPHTRHPFLSFLLAIALTASLAGAARASAGRIVVELEGDLAGPIPPTLSIRGPEGEETQTLTALSMAAGSVVFESLRPGTYRVELHATGAGESTRALEVGVYEGLTTVLHASVATGALRADPFRPDPFGVEDGWSADWLQGLPGAGLESASSLVGGASAARTMTIDGLEIGSSAMRNRPLVRGESSVRAARFFQGIAPVDRATGAIEVLSSFGPGGGDFELSTGTGGRDTWEGRIAREFPRAAWSPSVFIAVGGRDIHDADPSPTSKGDLSHNYLKGLEVQSRVEVRPGARTTIAASLFGEGTRRDHFVEAFRYDLRHAPRVDRASIEGRIEGMHRWEDGVTLRGTVGIQRLYVVGGDGRSFDDLLSYQRFNPGATEDSPLYWPGDNPATPGDEGHLFNYFRKDLHLDRIVTVDLWKDAGTARAAGAGLEMHFGTYRGLEHTNPANAAAPAQAIGYDALGERHDDGEGHEPGSPTSVAGYASLRRAWLGGEIEGGLRATIFRSGQRPLKDLSNPLGTNDRIDGEDLDAEKTFVGIDPRIGFTRAMGGFDLPFLPPARTRAWISAGLQTSLPPARALYYSATYLDRAALTLDPRTPPQEIYGNPGLEPERTAVALGSLGFSFSRDLWVSTSVEGRLTTNAWTPRYVDVGPDTLAFYDNGGDRRRAALFARMGWDLSQHVGLRVLYNLSQARTESVEPFYLESAWTDPDLPIQGIDTREGLPLLPPVAGGTTSGSFPSFWDRTHQIAAAALLRPPAWLLGDAGEILLEDLEITLTGRAASGLPFTVTQVHPMGLLDGRAHPSYATGRAMSSERLPWTGQVDARVSRLLHFFGIEGELWFEALNVTDQENVTRVYTATGDERDDAWIDSTEGRQETDQRGEEFAAAYRDRLLDPYNFGEPFQVRLGARVRFR